MTSEFIFLKEVTSRTMFLAAFFLLIGSYSPVPAYGQSLEKGLEEMLLQGEWGEISSHLEHNKSALGNPIARLVFGHSCQLLNRNNDSLSAFGSISNEKDLSAWLNYARSLTEEYPDNPISHYLLGDALARKSLFFEAIESFDASLQIDPSFVLPKVSQAVAKFYAGDKNTSLMQLVNTVNAHPNHVDAQLELGIMWMKFGASDKALEIFNSLIKDDENLALAYWGKGVSLFQDQNIYSRNLFLEKAIEIIPSIATFFGYEEIDQINTSSANSENRIDLNMAVSSKILIDIPGVDWKGGPRDHDWGEMLSEDKMTIYLRHKGPGIDDWDIPKESNAIVLNLPDKWDVNMIEQELQPTLSLAFNSGKDIQIVIDKNNTLRSHMFNPVPKLGRDEDIWAGKVTDYLLKNTPGNYKKTLAEHSRGTVTNKYISDFSQFDKVIVSSPRGDDALNWINKEDNLPPTFIVTGLTDAPSWRWKERLGKLRNKPNVHIIQYQELGGPKTTHSKLQNLQTEGRWKIFKGNSEHNFQGALGDAISLYSSKVNMIRHDALPIINQYRTAQGRESYSWSDYQNLNTRNITQSSAFEKPTDNITYNYNSSPEKINGVKTKPTVQNLDKGEWQEMIEFGLLYL